MNILFGIQGTGNGHISRSKILIHSLKNKNFNVDILLSGRNKNHYWGIKEFLPCNIKDGLTFSIVDGKVKKWKTLKNIKAKKFYNDIINIDLKGYDLVITDYEPITAWAAKKQKVLSIGISHQYSFLHDIPMEKGNYLERFIMNKFAPVSIPIGLHWSHFGKNILPPIIPKLPKKEIEPNSVLVYLPFENKKIIKKLLIPITDYNFKIYGHSQILLNEYNLCWKPFDRDGFLNDLIKSEAVLCNAGFELTSEGLSLNKKIMVKAVSGQIEQVSNCKALEVLNLTTVVKNLTSNKIKSWLDKNNSSYLPYKNVSDHIADWIENWDFGNLNDLVESTWED